MSEPRTAAGCAVVLLLLLVALLVVTTPWDPLADRPSQPGVAREDSVPSSWAAAADWRLDFTPAEREREVDFHRAVRPVGLLSYALGLAAVAVLGLSPLGARIVGRLGAATGGRWWLTAALAVAVATLLPLLITLPMDAHAESGRRAAGLSVRSWGGWASDVAKSWGIGVALTALAVLVLMAMARRSPDRWWVAGSLVAAGFVVAGSLLYPLVVEPAFNSFTPMADGPLRTRLLDLAERDGVRVEEVLVADASRRTTALNAYVSGLGATRRIVVHDTLLAAATEDEVALVVAHELGHVADDDVRDGTLMGALGAAAAVCALGALLRWEPLLRRVHVEGPGDPRVIPLLLALAALATAVTGPALLLVSRRVEARADVHALELTKDPRTALLIERRLAVTNLADLEPNPLLVGLFGSHPPSVERIALVREWARRAGEVVPPPLVAQTQQTQQPQQNQQP